MSRKRRKGERRSCWTPSTLGGGRFAVSGANVRRISVSERSADVSAGSAGELADEQSGSLAAAAEVRAREKRKPESSRSEPLVDAARLSRALRSSPIVCTTFHTQPLRSLDALIAARVAFLRPARCFRSSTAGSPLSPLDVAALLLGSAKTHAGYSLSSSATGSWPSLR